MMKKIVYNNEKVGFKSIDDQLMMFTEINAARIAQ
jgi:hypothetical protein